MKRKALLVNDSKFESFVLRDLLNQLNYDVEIADEFDAVYEVEKFKPDLIIVNYVMQRTTGDLLIQNIKSNQPFIKCLLSSSSSVKTVDFPQAQLDGILHTPISMFTLRNTLNRIGELIEEADSDIRVCDSCSQDISAFSMNIVFCPFCGDELQGK